MSETKKMSPMGRAAIALEKLNKKVAELQKAKTEPIAVVGMACRFPGGSVDPESYWKFLRASGDGVIEVPGDRWDMNEYYQPRGEGEPPTPGKMYLREGGFLKDFDIKGFDTRFFDIAPIEADSLDPQQRLLLEVTWEALEDAGARPDTLKNSRTGVFVGIMNPEYLVLQNQTLDPSQFTPYTGSGGAFSTAGGRLSFFLGLQGPNYSIDEACGSSLATTHLAIQSLRNGECNMAITGGVNLFMVPDSFIVRCQASMLAADGRCKTFDARANGYGPGEGAGMIVLKRLSDARRDGDRIYAVLRGSMVNHDGPASGLTVPNGVSQQQLMRDALANGGVAPEEVDYIECHGTGTPLGDPIEVGAIQAVFGREREKAGAKQGIVMGSAKSNFGHLESAAGIAGLIKAILCVQHGEIPGNANFQSLNPNITLDGTLTEIATELQAWPQNERPRRAGVSSFGFSGTNAHVVIEQAPETETEPVATRADAPRVFALSAREPDALRGLAGSWAQWLENKSEEDFYDICYTAAVKRARFPERLALPARNLQEARDQLATFAKGQDGAFTRTGTVEKSRTGKIAFVYSGQGSQWKGMAQGLLEAEPVFAAKLKEIDKLLSKHAKWSLLKELKAEEAQSRLDETEVAQPAIFAVQVALTELWRAWGVEPGAVVGHSVGEVAAAHISGKLSLSEAVKVIYHRARLMQAATGLGKMAAAGITADEGRKLIAGMEDKLAVAAINAPESIVFSGEESALEQVLAKVPEAVFKKMLPVNYAFHSPQMEPFKKELVETLNGLKTNAVDVPVFSTVTGRAAADSEYNAEYWGDNVRGAVSFAPAIQSMIEAGYNVFVEIGGHPVLQQPIMQTLAASEKEGFVFHSLRRGADEPATMLANFGDLYAKGFEPDWAKIYPGGKLVSLPPYAWLREQFWIPEGKGRRGGAGASDELAEWLYETRVEITEDLPPRTLDTAAHFLVFADLGGVGRALKKRSGENQNITLAFAGTGFKKIADDEYEVAPGSLEDIQKLAEAVLNPLAGSDRPIQILHLWSLDDPVYTTDDTRTYDLPALETMMKKGVITALEMVKAGLGVPWSDRVVPQIWFAVRGMYAQGLPEHRLPNPGPFAMQGFTRAMRVEYPANWGGWIDLDPDETTERQADIVLQEILTSLDGEGDYEDHTMYRDGERRVARLVPLTSGPRTPFQIHDDATYMITGGLTGIGVLFAEWLIERGAKHLILLGRTELPPREEWDGDLPDRVRGRIDDVLKLEAKLREKHGEEGWQIRPAGVDTSQEEVFLAFVEQMGTEMPVVRGVIHSAGLTEGKSVVDLTPFDMERVMEPKVQGGWVLHKAFENHDLDFFVLFSSFSAITLGMGVGVANYSAGNHFLNGLARFRRAQGKPALSIAWGAWKEVGTGQNIAASLERQGIFAIDPRRGVQILERLLELQDAAVVVAQKIDWKLFFESQSQAVRSSPFMRALPRDAVAAAPAAGTPVVEEEGPAEGALTREELLAASAADRAALLQDYFRDNVAAIMRTEPDRLDVNRSLQDSGVDSLMAVEIRNRFGKDLGFDLSASKIIDGSSIVQISGQLLEKLAADEFSAQGNFTEHPLSAEQQGIWYLKQLQPQGTAYHNVVALHITQELDALRLGRAFEELTARHSILRTTYLEKEGSPVQLIHESLEPDLEHYEEHEIEAFDDNDVRDLVQEEINIPFDFEKGPMARLRLFSRSATSHVFLLFAHQIALDEPSLRRLAGELLERYHELSASSAPAELAPPEKAYIDYVAAQEELLSGKEGERLEKFWLEQLKGDLSVVSPPADRIRPPVRITKGDSHGFVLDGDLLAGLETLAGKSGVSLEKLLCAGFFTLLHRMTERTDILMGVPGQPENRDDFAEVLGLFTTATVLRLDLSGDPSFDELLERMNRTYDEAMAHRTMPFPRVVERLRPLRYPARSPVFQILFETDGFHGDAGVVAPNVAAEPYPVEPRQAHYELILRLTRQGDTVAGRLTYKTDVYNDRTISKGVDRFLALLDSAAKDSSASLSRLELLPEDEASFIQYLNEPQEIETMFENRFALDLLEEPGIRTVHQLFDAVAARVPGAIAVFTGDNLEHRFTYAELSSRSNRLARRLMEKGVKPGSLVGVSVGRSMDQVASILAVLKAGGAVLSLDPAYSITRLSVFLNDAQPQLLLTQERYRERFVNTGIDTFCLDDENQEPLPEDDSVVDAGVGLGDTAFVFYAQQDEVRYEAATISHDSVFTALRWQVRSSSMGLGSRTLWYNSMSSPVAIQEIFATLCAGGILISLPRRALQDLFFIRFLKVNAIERVFSNQTMLRTIAEVAEEQDFVPVYLREIIGIGERFFISETIIRLFQEKLRGCSLHYHFGIREHFLLTSFILNEESIITNEWPAFLPIGRPIDGVKTFVLDSHLNLAPVGFPGELFVAGTIPGYLHKATPEQNKIVPDPFGKTGESFLMRTGLMVRLRSDGNLHLVGLGEQQINLRGLTINLREIESLLEEHPAIQEAYVEENKEIGGNGLLAYIVSDRIVDRLTVPIKCQVEYEGVRKVLITYDISPNGLSLQSVPNDWEKEKTLKLDILLPGLSEVSLSGKITWVDKKNRRAGVRFEPERTDDGDEEMMMARHRAQLKRSLSYVLEMEQLSLNHQSATELRIPLRRQCRVVFEDKRWELTTSEISSTGISLSDAPEDWKPGFAVTLIMNLAGQEISLNCVLAWREKTRTGFNIMDRNAEMEKLQKYLRHYTENELLSIALLRSYLKDILPYYMIPSIFVILESIPRLPEGAINRSKLRFPVRKWYEAEVEKVAPRTSIEGLLVGIWAEVLGKNYEDIGINDNFFEIGGYSLLAVNLLFRIREEFNTTLPFQSLYKAPTVADLASEIIQKKSKPGQSDEVQEAIQQLDSLSKEDLKELVLTQLTREENDE